MEGLTPRRKEIPSPTRFKGFSGGLIRFTYLHVLVPLSFVDSTVYPFLTLSSLRSPSKIPGPDLHGTWIRWM